MGPSVTRRTKCDEILLKISPKMASKLNVMNLQGVHPAAILTSPAVSLEDFAAQSPVFFRVKL
jgi:hypothetical protein